MKNAATRRVRLFPIRYIITSGLWEAARRPLRGGLFEHPAFTNGLCVHQLKALFNACESVVHLRLHSFQPQVISARHIDLFADSDQLVAVVGKRLPNLRHVSLKLFQDLIQQFISHLGHEVHCTRKRLRIRENKLALSTGL
jgi:hypothetical protein